MKAQRLSLLFVAVLAGVLMAGCGDSGSGELSKTDEGTLRNNMTRQLTPEEIARLGGGASDGKGNSSPGNAATAPKKEGQ